MSQTQKVQSLLPKHKNREAGSLCFHSIHVALRSRSTDSIELSIIFPLETERGERIDLKSARNCMLLLMNLS